MAVLGALDSAIDTTILSISKNILYTIHLVVGPFCHSGTSDATLSSITDATALNKFNKYNTFDMFGSLAANFSVKSTKILL